MIQTWIYHENKEPKIIDSVDLKKYQDKGWADSPAVFLNYEDIGLDAKKIEVKDEEEIVKAGKCFETVEGLVDLANGIIPKNLKKMDKNQLEAFAKKHFEVDLDRRKSKGKLIKEIEALANDDS
jgi:hypothetical protein